MLQKNEKNIKNARKINIYIRFYEKLRVIDTKMPKKVKLVSITSSFYDKI